MKIVSKIKDFYDFQVQKWGLDEKVVYVRNGQRLSSVEEFRIYVEGDNEKRYYGREALLKEDSDGTIIQNSVWSRRIGHWVSCDFNYVVVLWVGDNRYIFAVQRYQKYNSDDVASNVWLLGYKGDFKRVSDAPVYVELYRHNGSMKRFADRDVYHISCNNPIKTVENPVLMNSKITKLLNPEEIYLAIYSYISARNEKDIKDNRTNNEKIISNGFDTKTSFRNVK